MFPTTPTTVIHGVTGDTRMRRPIGSMPGKYRSAKARLTIVTGCVSSRSPAVKSRPATSGIPIASKKPGPTFTCTA